MAADRGYIKESLAKTFLLNFYIDYNQTGLDWSISTKAQNMGMHANFSYSVYLAYLLANAKYFS